MSVGELKKYLDNFDDRADVFYFDSESGEDRPLNTDWLTIEDSFESED